MSTNPYHWYSAQSPLPWHGNGGASPVAFSGTGFPQGQALFVAPGARRIGPTGQVPNDVVNLSAAAIANGPSTSGFWR